MIRQREDLAQRVARALVAAVLLGGLAACAQGRGGRTIGQYVLIS